jgi:branched-chain amino acid transport system permease protein
MDELLQHLVNGVSLGSIYALVALGYTLVYGNLRLINFAHGDIFMAGAYAALFASAGISLVAGPGLLHLSLVLLAAMLAAGLLGLAIERLAYRPLRKAPRVNLLMTAVGVSLLLENLAQVLFGATPRVFPTVLQERAWLHLSRDISISNIQVTVLAVSLILMLFLEWLVRATALGRAMRAVAFSHELAALMGVPVDRIIALTFCLGSSLAAAAGVLVGISYPRVDPLMGVLVGLKAFVAAVLGGIGDIRGAVAGGLLLGLAEELVAGYVSTSYRDALAFALLILILLVKPAGLLGRSAPEKV